VNVWLQLALAYRGAGKHVASLKTLVRVRQLDPVNWHAGYLVGDVQRQLGLYEAGIKSFEAVQSEPADEDDQVKETDSQTLKDRQVVVKTAVVETQLLLAHSQIRDGFSARGAGTLGQCIEGSLSLLDLEGFSARVAWKLIADSLLKLGQLSSPPTPTPDERDPLEDMLTSILEKLSEAGIDSKNPILQDLVTVKLVKAKLGQLDLSIACLFIAVLSYSMRVLLHSGSGAEDGDEGLGCAWFDLGHSIHQLKPHISSLRASPAEAEAEEIQDEDQKKKKKQEECTTQAIQCLRYALQKEPLNGNFWNLLGVIAAPSTPKLGQHALIRACELNVRVSRLSSCPLSILVEEQLILLCVGDVERCPLDESGTVLPLSRGLRAGKQSFLARASSGPGLPTGLAGTGCSCSHERRDRTSCRLD
jgi:superkiller protein 3